MLVASSLEEMRYSIDWDNLTNIFWLSLPQTTNEAQISDTKLVIKFKCDVEMVDDVAGNLHSDGIIWDAKIYVGAEDTILILYMKESAIWREAAFLEVLAYDLQAELFVTTIHSKSAALC